MADTELQVLSVSAKLVHTMGPQNHSCLDTVTGFVRALDPVLLLFTIPHLSYPLPLLPADEMEAL